MVLTKYIQEEIADVVVEEFDLQPAGAMVASWPNLAVGAYIQEKDVLFLAFWLERRVTTTPWSMF